MGVVRSDLVIPFQIAVFRVQGQDTIRVKIIAGPVTVVGVGIRITGGPVERISFRIVRTCQPGRSPARFWRIAAQVSAPGSPFAGIVQRRQRRFPSEALYAAMNPRMPQSPPETPAITMSLTARGATVEP